MSYIIVYYSSLYIIRNIIIYLILLSFFLIYYYINYNYTSHIFIAILFDITLRQEENKIDLLSTFDTAHACVRV